MANKDTALDTLAREELGIDPSELGGSAWMAGASSFCLFAAGAIFPVAPFFLRAARRPVVSLALSGIALAAIGAGTSLFTGRNLAFSAAAPAADRLRRRGDHLRHRRAGRRIARRLTASQTTCRCERSEAISSRMRVPIEIASSPDGFSQ